MQRFSKRGFMVGIISLAAASTVYVAAQRNDSHSETPTTTVATASESTATPAPSNGLVLTAEAAAPAKSTQEILDPPTTGIETSPQPVATAEIKKNTTDDTISPEPAVAAASQPQEQAGDKTPLNSEELRRASAELAVATEQVNGDLPLGPLVACFNQMREFACPIAGSIPVVKDVVGRIAMGFGISCPTSLPSSPGLASSI